jgi:hypothetical protein
MLIDKEISDLIKDAKIDFDQRHNTLLIKKEMENKKKLDK